MLELGISLFELLACVLEKLIEVIVVLRADLGVLELDLLTLVVKLPPLLDFSVFLLR